MVKNLYMQNIKALQGGSERKGRGLKAGEGETREDSRIHEP